MHGLARTASWMLLGLAVCAPQAACQPNLFPQYEDLADRYRAGRRDEALTALAQWREDDVRAVVLQAVVVAWPKCGAAMLLHTDLALKLHAGTLPDGYDLHVNAALTLAGALRRTTGGTRIVARWLLAMALCQASPRSALGWLDAGLQKHPDDAYLLLALGALEESFVAFGTMRFGRDGMRRDAESHLRRALKADDSLHEGRLRLAHLLMGRGDGNAALAALDVVLARSQDKDLLYLAHLFLGRIREHQGRAREAVLAYTAAVAVDERWQTARLALSQARWRLGDAQGALDALQPIVAPEPARAESMDPWWLYPWVQGWRAEALLEALRQEVSR